MSRIGGKSPCVFCVNARERGWDLEITETGTVPGWCEPSGASADILFINEDPGKVRLLLLTVCKDFLTFL